jgi:hypothetical protein
MKAFLIDAATQTITPVTLTNGLNDIGVLIGFDTFDSDEIDASGDRLFFDERCFLREQTGKARFKIDNLAPVANKALVVGSADDGAILKDVMVDMTTLERRITWL